ncbi:SDR family oxidoreductase [Hoyosella sp. YIM 151337]|uniref:type I polyketide synthase n=1 Tax=Hoyosella sp. YIM 151337 TaxID=2992742 RepID=UPI00223686AD|nr:type I polyketide synthase [Hoyosella sp. YIM 151337]MCW4354242.1 SDR family oxidoreductase [Hoyosella sp. YIM 151337]
MQIADAVRDLVLAVGPLGYPNAKLVAAATHSGAQGVLDLADGRSGARRELARAARMASSGFGVRLSADCAIGVSELPSEATFVVLTVDAISRASEFRGRRILAEVTSQEQARAARDAGADGVIVRGCESGGTVGDLSSFVLLQQLAADETWTRPVWLAGGIGPDTAAAAVIGGARGVVLDVQLALLQESVVPGDVRAILAGIDGSESAVEGGRRTVGRMARGGRVELPVGEDGYLARTFETRFGSVAAAVRAVRDAITSSVTAPGAAASMLAAASPLADALGTALPLAQGPMTRVSDQPQFAHAVAAAGAVPFIALAVNSGARSREILDETKQLAGDRPWGVGILGFADPQLREEQLEAVLATRPTHAIIAGGRPAQASRLEAEGISTFLHVPSPGLLRQFLGAGARKFIFEGAECGGHVGPRHSFPLWQAQLDELQSFLQNNPSAAAELQVFFAGGIHDERSAAMVAALAHPLTAAGVKTGLLAGTAYLFTAEAVTCGAIVPGFQQQVVAATHTVLLETAPGHATRCVDSEFAQQFAGLRDKLTTQGVPDRERWETLEQFNIGRLRVASKGLDRDGDALVTVGADRQRRDGMYMAGDVALLRDRVVSIADVHDAMTTGAAQWYHDRSSDLTHALGLRPAEEPQPAPLDIAIVGMAAMFPQAPTLSAFWSNILAGVDAVTEVPADRWDPELYYSPGSEAGKTPSKWGGFLPPIPFDPLRFGIPPASLASIEPTQLLALEIADRALRDAGYDDRPFDRQRTAVIFGAESGSDLSNAGVLRNVLPSYLGELPTELDAQLPKLTEDSFPGVLANVISGRIANRLNLGGANYTVDAACASSLAALDAACKELVSGSAEMVLCGGIDLHNGINDYLMFASVHALSPTGRSATFDSAADGIALGEGAGCVVLKRLSDAERDGDRVYAVIKGVGSASDGKSLGLTAPRPEGQRAALERAYRNANLSPAAVGVVEAHGTGTVVGDRTELATLTALFSDAGVRAGQVTLGSVKSQIGHTKCAAGLAGLIKVALSIYTGVKPPTLHVRTPNPAWQEDHNPFAFTAEPLPWEKAPGERIAGVSAFGFGGTNFHAVLSGHDATLPPAHTFNDWPVELFTFRGATENAALGEAREFLSRIGLAATTGGGWTLRDWAYAAARTSDAAASRGEPVWIAFVAMHTDELRDILTSITSETQDAVKGVFVRDAVAEGGGKVAFLFPGQGSQRPRMGAGLLVAFPHVQHHVQRGAAYAHALYPAAAFSKAAAERHRAAITDTRVAQPALGIVEMAFHDLLRDAGIVPDMVGGHSYGELAALAAAGVLDPDTLLELSAARAEAIVRAAGDLTDQGAMAAVSATTQGISDVLNAAGLGRDVVIANENAPKQNVISGPTPAVAAAADALKAAGLSVKRINVACAFHSPVVAAATELFAQRLAETPLYPAELPVYSNTTAAVYPDSRSAVRDGLAQQISAPVRFREQVSAMYDAGARVFIEVGPGAVLTKLTNSILAGKQHAAVALDDGRSSGLAGLLTALAQLAAAGVDQRTSWLFDGRDAVIPDPAVTIKRPGWTVDGHLVRTADGSIPQGALAPATQVRLTPAMSTTPPPSPGAEALISEFLRTSREMVAAQRDVLLGYLGAGANVPSSAPIINAPQPAQVTFEPEPAETGEPAETQHPAHTEKSVLSRVYEVIGRRTGYPVDMIEPDLDLEADLSVDSIKRAEIAGELAAELGLDTADDSEIEEVSKARTAAAIAELLASKLGAAATPAVISDPASPASDAATVIAPQRLLMRPVPITPIESAPQLAGLRVLVIGGGPLAEALKNQLHALDATPIIAAPSFTAIRAAMDVHADGVFYLGSQDRDDAPSLPDAFPILRELIAASPRWLLAAGPGEGLRGFFRTVSREYPDLHASVVESNDLDVHRFAAALAAETAAAPGEPVVLLDNGERSGLALESADLGAAAMAGAGPSGVGMAEAAALGLDQDSVVLMVGGARGITARFAATLAGASRCHIELVGRTPLSLEAEDPRIAAASSASDIRAALIEMGLRTPAEIESAVSRTLAEREVRGTLERLRELGATVRYRSADIRDPESVTNLVHSLHAEHGRLDGIVYAAGVIEDKLIAEKAPESFARVYTTKVAGARHLIATAEGLSNGPRFMVFFGSIAAVLGNRGQADYAAANDELEALGRNWSVAGKRRGLTVHWGPWAPTGENNGMVTPELMRSYAKRGVALIDPEEGTASLLRELAWGDESANAVVYTASGW